MRDIVRRQEGRVASVAGAAQGQGRTHADRLAAEAPLEEALALAEKHGARLICRRDDIRDFEVMESVVPGGVAEIERLDVVTPHAGTFVTVRVAIPLMIDQGQGESSVITSLDPILMVTPHGSMSQPENIADEVAWLPSDEGCHISGIQRPVDLGTLVR